MNDKKRSLHRIAYFAQVRNRRAFLIGWDKLPFPESQKKESEIQRPRPTLKKRPNLSILKGLKARLFALISQPDTYKAIPSRLPQIESSVIAKKKFATKIKAVDVKDKHLKVFLGPEITASSVEQAQYILDINNQDYIEIIGELTVAYDNMNQDVTWLDRQN